MNDDPALITLMVISSLNKLGIDYLISGSFASAFYGEPRSTRVVDLLADVRLEHVEKLCELLKDGFYIEPDAIKYALKYTVAIITIQHTPDFMIVAVGI